MNKIISLQSPISLPKKSEAQFVALAETPTATLTQWSDFLKSHKMNCTDFLQTINTILNMPLPKHFKWYKGITTKTMTCFGFDHGDQNTKFSTDYTKEIMYHLTKNNPNIIYLESLPSLNLEKIAPKKYQVMTLKSINANGWYMSGFSIMERICEHSPLVRDSLTVKLPTPPYTVNPTYSDDKDVKKNNKNMPTAYLRFAASVMIDAVCSIETPHTPILKDSQYQLSWTTITLFSADMASQILINQLPVPSKKISIGCGKAHEAQLVAFLSNPNLLYSFLIKWTNRINDLQKTHLPQMHTPFNLIQASSPPKTPSEYVDWMYQNKEFFGLK